jgi:cytidine deaminase
MKISDQTVQEMLKIAMETKKHAYAPYSNYFVGACILTENNKMFGGCNIENASYGLTICAESSAIFSMVISDERKIKAILVTGTGPEMCTPCGACRQRLREFAPFNAPVYCCNDKEVLGIMTVEELLPNSFGPQHLETKNELFF